MTDHREPIEALSDGRLNRRQMLQRAAALGIGASTLGPPTGVRAAAQTSGGELIVAAGGDVDTLDPHVSQLLLYGNMLRFTCFNSLVRYSPTLEYLPDLAESWENPDERTYLFRLRQGVKYHDGTEFEASHVESSFRRIAEKQTIFTSRVENVERYEVVDKYTIKITLNTIQADFIDGLVLLSIIPPDAAATIEETPVGTGPFRFVEWVPNDHLALERHPDYFEPGVPGVDKLTFRILTETQVAINNLKAGEVDAILELPVAEAVPFKEATDVTAMIQPTSKIHVVELMGKQSEAVLSSPKVRQALAHCLDKDAIQQTVYSGEGRQKWSFVPTDHWAYKELPGYPYDPERAKALLAEAGYPEGFELTVLCIAGSAYPEGEKTAIIWQAGLAEAGVKLNIENQELSVWVDNYINHTYDVIWNEWPGYADPNYFVAYDLKVHLADQWHNEEAVRLADATNATLDQAERTALYGQLQDIFVADLPVIIVQETPKASLLKPTVTGWEINPLGLIFLNRVTIGE